MRLKDLNDITKSITGKIDVESSIKIELRLSSDNHESLQQEVYRHMNKTGLGYKSRKSFDIIIGDIVFVIKRQ